MPSTITYIAIDGERLDFVVPKGCNRQLVARAVKAIHEGKNADLVTRGLVGGEYRLLIDIIESLQAHRVPQAV
jgi:predicted butyrate kinase (DUF1464 family)